MIFQGVCLLLLLLLIWVKIVVVVVVPAGCRKRFAFAASAAVVTVTFEDNFEKAEKAFFENQNGVTGKIDGVVAAGPWGLARRVLRNEVQPVGLRLQT